MSNPKNWDINKWSFSSILPLYTLKSLWFYCMKSPSTIVVFLFTVFSSTRDLFTDMETSPLPVKGCKFWPMLGTHGQWAESVFSVSHLLYGHSFTWYKTTRGDVELLRTYRPRTKPNESQLIRRVLFETFLWKIKTIKLDWRKTSSFPLNKSMKKVRGQLTTLLNWDLFPSNKQTNL